TRGGVSPAKRRAAHRRRLHRRSADRPGSPLDPDPERTRSMRNPETQLTEEELRSLAHAAGILGRRWKSILADARARADYRGLGLSEDTVGNLHAALTKLG